MRSGAALLTAIRSRPEVRFEPLHGAIDISELVETEESHPKRGEVVSFAAHQGYAGGHLDATLLELRAAADLGIIREGHDHAGGGKSFGGDGGEPELCEQGADSRAEGDLSQTQVAE